LHGGVDVRSFIAAEIAEWTKTVRKKLQMRQERPRYDPDP
jgi:hypothetical protein